MLEIRSARKTFYKGQPDEKVALDDLSLTLQTGEFGVVIGSNGAGKSTLIKMLGGAHLPDEGHLSLRGEEILHRRANLAQ